MTNLTRRNKKFRGKKSKKYFGGDSSNEFEKSKVKLIKTNINTFSSLIQKYGMEKISRANQLEELVMDSMQQTDFENNFIS
jgi:hypothetical protein